MMAEWSFAAALALLVAVVLGLIFLVKRPGGIDSFLAILLFGTTGVGIALALSRALGQSRLLDVALVFALLASILGAVLVLRSWPGTDSDLD